MDVDGAREVYKSGDKWMKYNMQYLFQNQKHASNTKCQLPFLVCQK